MPAPHIKDVFLFLSEWNDRSAVGVSARWKEALRRQWNTEILVKKEWFGDGRRQVTHDRYLSILRVIQVNHLG